MAADTTTPAASYPPASPAPVLRPITMDTVRESLMKGFDDFRAEPGWGLFFGGAYVLGGMVLWAIALSIDAVHIGARRDEHLYRRAMPIFGRDMKRRKSVLVCSGRIRPRFQALLYRRNVPFSGLIP